MTDFEKSVNENIEFIYGKLSSYEFLMELLWADHYTKNSNPVESHDLLASQIDILLSKTYNRKQANDTPESSRIQEHLEKSVKNFLEKVRTRIVLRSGNK